MDDCTIQFRPSFPAYSPPRYYPEKTYLNAYKELLRNCLFTYLFIWMTDGYSYWLYPNDYNSQMLSGYVWNGYSWQYACLYWDDIKYFF